MSKISGHNPLVVVGSVYANVLVQVERLPSLGETLPAKNGNVSPSGKGVNQAACAARLSYPTHLVGQVGKDGHATLIREALTTAGVHVDHLNAVTVPTGQSLVMMQTAGPKSAIILEGANVSWPRSEGGIGRLQSGAQQLIRCAGALLLQREVPDSVNIEAAKIAKNANVPVILDSSGADGPIPEELLKCVTVLSSNKDDLARMVGLSTEEPVTAARKCLELGVKQVLLKLNDRGIVLVTEDEEPHVQPGILAPVVLDTTLANDILTAAYAVAFVEHQPYADALKFAACAASLCVQSRAAITNIPDRKAVLKLVQEDQAIPQIG